MSTLHSLNFKSVQRTDPEALQLVCTSSHGVLYVFKDSKWEKAEIEGTVLLYQRKDGGWAFIILNRLHANNYRQLFGEIDSFQQDDGLLMFSTHSGTIFGLWIYAEEEKEEFVRWFDQIVNEPRESGTGQQQEMVAVCEEDDADSVTMPNTRSPGRAASDLRSLLARAVHQQEPVQQRQPSILDRLFSAASRSDLHSSPEHHPCHETIKTIPSAHEQIDLMLGYISRASPGMDRQHFRRIAGDLLMSDDVFWTALYDSYLHRAAKR